MAIEVGKGIEIKTPIWSIILGIFSVVLILVMMGSYFYLDRAAEKIAQKIQFKKQSSTATPLESDLESNLNLIGNRINLFGELLLNHRDSGKIFNLMESICLPNVQFSNFNFDSDQGTVSLSGKTDNFISLEQQLTVLRQEPLIKKVTLSNMSTVKEGGVSFSLSLIIDPKVFK